MEMTNLIMKLGGNKLQLKAQLLNLLKLLLNRKLWRVRITWMSWLTTEKATGESASIKGTEMSPKTQATPEKVTYKYEERNPYKFIEKTLQEAKVKLDKMKGTPQLLDTLSDVRSALLL